MEIEEFGIFLYNLRVNEGLDLKVAACRIGIDKHLLDTLERGIVRSFPRFKTLESLSKFYDFRFQYVPSQLLVVVPLLSEIEKIEKNNRDKASFEKIVDNCEDDDKGIISLKATEKIVIKKALEKCNGNREEAASRLEIGERTLYRKLKEYGINDDRGKAYSRKKIEISKEDIKEAIEETMNRLEASKKLDIAEGTLYRKIKEYGLGNIKYSGVKT